MLFVCTVRAARLPQMEGWREEESLPCARTAEAALIRLAVNRSRCWPSPARQRRCRRCRCRRCRYIQFYIAHVVGCGRSRYMFVLINLYSYSTSAFPVTGLTACCGTLAHVGVPACRNHRARVGYGRCGTQTSVFTLDSRA